MPSKQTSSGTSRKAAQSTRSGAAARGAASTGERDEHYDLISVLYHALQGAETCARYVEDARNADEEELVSFFEETRSEYADRATLAKQLLAQRLEGASAELEEEEEDEDDEE